MNRFLLCFTAFVMMVSMPQMAWAAEDKLPWWGILLLVSSISTAISVVLVWRNKKFETFTEKAMSFGAWFWFVIFIQIMLYGFYIGLTK